MGRKTIADIDPELRAATEAFKALSLVKGEMARDAYAVQDKATKKAIDRIVATLQQHARGEVNLKVGNTLVPVKVDDQTLGFNLFYLAVEIVKDLGFVGIKVANFKFPAHLCVRCGEEVKGGR